MSATLPVYASDILHDFINVRQRTCDLAKGLSDADATVQSMEDASPAKWHLAHTTWFFETFILVNLVEGFKVFNPKYNYLFNSYYEAIGARQQRSRRGMLTRPSLDEITQYRVYIDEHMVLLIQAGLSSDWQDLLRLGLNHEQQHQELLLTDILHLFAQNPLKPAYAENRQTLAEPIADLSWHRFDGGVQRFGYDGASFAFDCETPAHEVLLRDFEFANRAVTNAEWITFIEDGGYQDPKWWVSDGWAFIQNHQITTPLYWSQTDHDWTAMGLHGLQPLNMEAPVSHVSLYEADAYATWAGARLPTEYEWEKVARTLPHTRNVAAQVQFSPQPQVGSGVVGVFGGVWEWTSSPFTPYPGFKPAAGAVGEYNGKFMSGQMVLRGGSFATPTDHIRATYRNFFQPEKRWQFSGLRLARDC